MFCYRKIQNVNSGAKINIKQEKYHNKTELTLFSLCFLRKIKGTIKELKKYHKMCKDVFPRMTEEWALF